MRHKGLYTLTSIIIAALIGVAFELYRRRPIDIPSLAVASHAPLQPRSFVTAPGRVGAISEEIEIGAEIPGKVKAILVEEGSHVQAGQPLAIIENNDYEAQSVSAEARLSQADAELRRVINGARSQERRVTWAVVEQTAAIMRNAEIELERRQQLFQRGALAGEEADRGERDLRVARARYQEAKERYALIDAKAREEDRPKAQAAVALARAQVSEARVRLEKRFIRAPITGVVIRKRLHVGQSVAPEGAHAALFTIADTRMLRVRVDVDQIDVGKIRLGQRAYVTADAYSNQKFWGQVVGIGHMLRKKYMQRDDSAERVDTEILETLIELDSNQRLPLGLRVEACILMSNSVTAETIKRP